MFPVLVLVLPVQIPDSTACFQAYWVAWIIKAKGQQGLQQLNRSLAPITRNEVDLSLAASGSNVSAALLTAVAVYS